MESELAERMKIQNELAKTVKADDAPQDQDSGGTIIIFWSSEFKSNEGKIIIPV